MTTVLWCILGYSYHTCETDTLAIGWDEQKLRATFTKHISGEIRPERYLSFTKLSLIRLTIVDEIVVRESEIARVDTESLHWWRHAREKFE